MDGAAIGKLSFSPIPRGASGTMDDESPMGKGPPLYGEDSYLEAPAADFENSRGEGVAAFAQNLNFASGSQSGGATNVTAGAGGDGRLWAAWSNAASEGGGRPTDFGFLLKDGAGVSGGRGGASSPDIPSSQESFSSGDGDESMTPDASGRARTKKRVRTAMDQTPVFDPASKASMPKDTLPACPPLVLAPAPVLPPAPRPPQRPREVRFGKIEGEDRGPNPMQPPAVRTDVFAWMRTGDPMQNEEIKGLLEEESRYTEAAQAHVRPLREVLYREMFAHQREADTGLLTPHPGGYGYFTQWFVGKSYQAHYRRRALPAGGWAEEELVLDENQLAVDGGTGDQRPFCSVCGPEPSPSHNLYAYATDFCGNDAYTLHVLSMSSKQAPESTPVALERTDGSAHWSLAGDAFYYVGLDGEFRQEKVKLHMLGSDPRGAADVTVLEEADRKFYLSVGKSGCGQLLVLTSASSETSEVQLLDLTTGTASASLRRVVPRQFEHRYDVDHRGGCLYILTNKDGAKNKKLCRLPLSKLPDAALDTWEDMWVPQDGTMLCSHRCFQSFIAMEGRERGECRIFVHGYGDGGPPLHAVAFPDASTHSGRMLTPRGATAARAAFSASLGDNRTFDSETIRYSYESFTIPGLTYEYNVRTREHKLLKRSEVPYFNSNLYRAEQITTHRRSVPLSLVYRKDIHQQGLAGGPFPLLLTGYGAYGCCQDPDFDGNRLSLLDRGVVYALAHVRGGGELGRSWYEEGRYLAVKSRFADFVDAAETLVDLHITTPDRLAAWGTSSGGLLVTASMNLRPDLFRAALLEVPFVDALNTMGDPSIPLTVGEWEEIGNPNEREYFYYMLEYSPYDNIRMERYPALLVTTSLNDSMVGYWEPLKYVSKLRLMRTNGDWPVLLRPNFHAGHGASSDRYEGTRDYAFAFAFLLEQLGLATAPLLDSVSR